MAKPNKPVATDGEAKNYKHPEAASPMRPEVGTQANFRKKKAPVTVIHLILETKGFDDLAEVKTQAAQRWVNAVNADGTYGIWKFAMARKIGEVRGLIDKAG